MLNKARSNSIFLFLTMLIAAFPLLAFGIRSVVSILWFVAGLTVFFKTQEKKAENRYYELGIFMLPFLLVCISLINSTNISEGLNVISRMLSLLIFPLVFFLNRDYFDSKKIQIVLYTFSYSVLVFVIYQIIHVALNYDFLTQEVSLKQAMGNGYNSIAEIPDSIKNELKIRRFRDFTIKKTKSHTTYQGLFLCFSIFFLLFKSFQEEKSLKITNIISSIILFSWLLVLSVRMPFFALIFSSIITSFIFYKMSLKTKLFLVSLISLMFLVLCFSQNPLSVRFKQYYKTGFSILDKTSKKTDYNSANVRNGVFFCDIELIKQHPIKGVGIGDLQDELNTCYNENIGANIYNEHTFNSHNQYAFFWISSGILGFLSFVLLIVNIFYKSLKSNQQFLFYLITINALVFITENTLVRSDGVLFFSFFCSLIYFNRKKK